MISVTQDASLRLLDRPVSPDLLAQRTAELKQPKILVHRGARSAVIFRLGDEWFALATGVFQEVVENRVLHSLPHQRGGLLKGLVNVRGHLVLCVALEALLSPGQELVSPQLPQGSALSTLLVCNREGDRLTFPVREVSGVFRFNPDELRQAPATLASAAAGTFTNGMLPWRDRMVACLDDQLLFYAVNKGLA